MQKKIFTSVLFLAGGIGSRMGEGIPKQFRMLKHKPLFLYSFELFNALPEVNEIVVVCDPAYRSLFPLTEKPLQFVMPGKERQDSVYHALIASSPDADLICTHDAVRPFLQKTHFLTLLAEAQKIGAAALASPSINTIKQIDREMRVLQTLNRKNIWQIQSPQAVRRELFLRAYGEAKKNSREFTDDLSLIEAIGEPATLVPGSPDNFKITTPFDWAVAETLYSLQFKDTQKD